MILNNGNALTFFALINNTIPDPGINDVILYETQNKDGEYIAPRKVANTDQSAQHSQPKVLQFTDQSFVVGWVFSNPEDEHSGVGYQRFDSLGNKVGDEVKFLSEVSSNITDYELLISDDTVNFKVSLPETNEIFISSDKTQSSHFEGGIYRTVSGEYIADVGGLKVNELPKTSITLTTSSNKPYDFQNTPTGAIAFSNNTGGAVYYQSSNADWFRDLFNNKGIFEVTESLTLSNVLADESIYNVDLNYDTHVGGVISSIVTDNQNFALYKIASGAYISDISGLKIGDLTNDPTLLIQQTVSRGKVTSSLYELNSTITGALSYPEGDFSIYYQDSKGAWKRDNFDTNGLFEKNR